MNYYTRAISEWSRHRMRNLFHLAIVLAPLCLCSCMTATYDVRGLSQPVVFNDNPCLLRPGTDSIKLTDVDSYSAYVQKMVMAASSQQTTYGPVYNTTVTTTTTMSSRQDNARFAATLKLGGHPNRVIRDVSLNAYQWGMNMVCALADVAEIRAAGRVTEPERVVAASAEGDTKQ